MKGQRGAVHDDRPQRFQPSGKRQRARTKHVTRRGGPAERLYKILIEPFAFVLTAKDLGIPEEHAIPSALYSEVSVAVWRDAIARAFNGCAYYALEVGNGDYNNPKRGYVHAHVIADKNDGPKHLIRGAKNCQPIYDLSGEFHYLNKLAENYSREAHFDYLVARILTGTTPRLKGWLTSKDRQSWNASQRTLASLITPIPLP